MDQGNCFELCEDGMICDKRIANKGAMRYSLTEIDEGTLLAASVSIEFPNGVTLYNLKKLMFLCTKNAF